MTNREVFEKVKAHLLEQGVVSTHPVVGCAYRGPDGLKCAVGCLIRDEDYHLAMEGTSINLVASAYNSTPTWGCSLLGKAMTAAGVPISARGLLVELQTLHDNHDPAHWRDRLDEIEQLFFGADR